MLPVCLQISLTPLDLGHAALILPHQLNFWASACQELLLVWDLNPGPRLAEPLYRQRWERGLSYFELLNQTLQRDYPRLRILTVDDAAERQAQLSARFLAGAPMPLKDFRGGPFYAYFEALERAELDWVLHLDADKIFAGVALPWLSEALAFLQRDARYFCLCPPGGPPRIVGNIGYANFTSRAYLLDRRNLPSALPLRHRDPERLRTQGLSAPVPPYAELPEHLLSDWMHTQGKRRLELRCTASGADLGVFSLHPPTDSASARQLFEQHLPRILQLLALGQIPELQRGHFNLQAAWLKQLAQGA